MGLPTPEGMDEGSITWMRGKPLEGGILNGGKTRLKAEPRAAESPPEGKYRSTKDWPSLLETPVSQGIGGV